jgi:hypothetical protein
MRASRRAALAAVGRIWNEELREEILALPRRTSHGACRGLRCQHCWPENCGTNQRTVSMDDFSFLSSYPKSF